MSLKVKLVHPDAKIPTQAHNTDAGYDLYSIQEYIIQPNQTQIIKTGICFKIPNNHFIMICSRSGLAAKHGVFVLNSPGIIDVDYVEEIMVILHNSSNKEYSISKHDRIAQAVIFNQISCNLELVSIIDETLRFGGLGSTGK